MVKFANIICSLSVYISEMWYHVHYLHFSQGHMAQWIKALARSSDIPKKNVSSIPGQGNGELSQGK